MGKHVLAFLSMKRFHPARQDNQYKLFKAESDHKNLKKKQEEYQKIYEEEQRELLKQQREDDLKKKLISEEQARKQKIVSIHQKKKTRRGKKKSSKKQTIKSQAQHQKKNEAILENLKKETDTLNDKNSNNTINESVDGPKKVVKKKKKSADNTEGGVLDGHTMDDMVNIQAKQAAIAGETKDINISATGVDLGKTANVKQSVNFLYLVPPGYKESLTRQAMEDEKRDEMQEKINERERREQERLHMLELQREALAKGIPFKRSFANEDDLQEVEAEEDDQMNDDHELDVLCERCKQRGHSEGDPICPLGKFDPVLNRQIIAQNPFEPIEHREKTIRDVGLNIQPLDSTGGIDGHFDLKSILGDLSVDDLPRDELLLHFTPAEIELLQEFEIYKKKYKRSKKKKKKKKKKKVRYDSDSDSDNMPSFLSSSSSSFKNHSNRQDTPPAVSFHQHEKERRYQSPDTPPAAWSNQQRHRAPPPPPPRRTPPPVMESRVPPSRYSREHRAPPPSRYPLENRRRERYDAPPPPPPPPSSKRGSAPPPPPPPPRHRRPPSPPPPRYH